MSDLINWELLESVALAATKGKWTGDRIDGTVKYNIICGRDPEGGENAGGYDSDLDYEYGVMKNEDEQYLLNFYPSVVVKLLSELKEAKKNEARYLWLRDRHWVDTETALRLGMNDPSVAGREEYHAELDSSIDSRINAL